MTHINRKIIITIDGEKGQSGKTTVEITENGKPKTRFEWTEATFTSLILMEIATDILCACHEDMMKHWMKLNHVPDARKKVEEEHIADVSNMMDRPEVDEDERMRMLFDCLGSDCTLNRKLLEANGCSIEEMLAFIEKEREEAEKRHERIEQRWKEVQEIDRSMRELRKNLFGEEKEPKTEEWTEEIQKTIDNLIYDIERFKLQGFFTHQPSSSYINFLKSIRPRPMWTEDERRKLNRIFQILGQAAEDKGFLTSKRIIGDKEAVELQDFIRDICFSSKAEALKDLPKWKKASAGTKLPSESVIRAEGQDPRFGSVAVYDCEYITINELGKLPKED